SVVELTFMECKGCGFSCLQDIYELDHHWITEIVLAPDEPVPGYIAPLAPTDWFHNDMVETSEQTEVDIVPVRVYGCAMCYGDDASSAWEASRVRRKLTALAEDSHFSVRAF